MSYITKGVISVDCDDGALRIKDAIFVGGGGASYALSVQSHDDLRAINVVTFYYVTKPLRERFRSFSERLEAAQRRFESQVA